MNVFVAILVLDEGEEVENSPHEEWVGVYTTIERARIAVENAVNNSGGDHKALVWREPHTLGPNDWRPGTVDVLVDPTPERFRYGYVCKEEVK